MLEQAVCILKPCQQVCAECFFISLFRHLRLLATLDVSKVSVANVFVALSKQSLVAHTIQSLHVLLTSLGF
jgi:hypothetical protein